MLIINETVDIRYESNTLLLRYFNDIPHYNTKLSGSELARKIDDCYIAAQPALDEIEDKYPQIVELLHIFHELRTTFPVSPFLQSHLKGTPISDVKKDIYKDIKSSVEEMNGTTYDDSFSLFQCLNESSIEDSHKWNLITLYEEAETLYPQFIEAINLLNPYCQKLIDSCTDEIKEFVDGWKDLGKDATRVLDESFGMKTNLDKNQLYPSVIAVNQGSFYYEDIFLGLVLNATFKDSRKMDFDRASEVCKLLGDQTKSKIVQLLMKEDMYGKQIANELELTSATISYHIQELLEAMIITVEAQEGSNRLYYVLNKETILDALDYLREQFS